jgi:putative redox protein
MIARVEVEYGQRDRQFVRIRDHELITDQPVEDGGDDLGPTPTELFVAGLAACVGFYAERYLRRHELPVEGLRVGAEFTLVDTPARVGSIQIHVDLPEDIPDKRRATLLTVVENCTVHNSLRHPPEVGIDIRTPVLARAGREAQIR